MSAPFGHEQFETDIQPVNEAVAEYLRKVGLAAAPVHKRRILSLDYETYSEADLPRTGASVYAAHPTTEVMMLAYRFLGDEEVRQWVPSYGEPMPEDLRAALHDPSVTLAAWNAPFERAITEYTLKISIPRERWLDVMALSYSLSLPGALGKCGEVVGLGEDAKKMSRGKLLVRKFCKPRKPTKNKPWTRETAETSPEEWEEFLLYNRQDVVAEQAIYRRLRKYQMPDHEWKLWHLDQKINDAGIPINLRAVRAALALSQRTIAKDMAEMRGLTGLANPNSGAQLLPWLNKHGYVYQDLKKGHVERAAKELAQEVEDMPDMGAGFDGPLGVYFRESAYNGRELLNRVLQLRLRVSKSSVKKFPTLMEATDSDGNLRGCHQFAGAGRTWRWSGRRFQPQNLSKPSKDMEKFLLSLVPTHGEDGHELSDTARMSLAFKLLCDDIEQMSVEEIWTKYDQPEKNINPMEALVAAVRPMVQAPEGYTLIDADLSAIENVVLGWLARDDKILRVFREGLDPYIDFATDMFKMTYQEILDSPKMKLMRTTAKPGVLGCGYMLSAGTTKENRQTGELEATGLLGYGWNMGVDLTPEMADLSVKTFRSKFEKVVQFWWDLDDAVRKVVKTKRPQTVGYLEIDYKSPFLRIKLPSNRYLHYMRPKMQKWKMPWKDRNGAPVFKESITYENMETGQWKRVSTHPGKLAENVTQAVARDLLAHGMTLADEAGIDIRMHVHDQIIGVSEIAKAPAELVTLIDCMTSLPDWADDKMPLKAAGHSTPVFIKD
jgi:DNA polymerase